MTTFTVEQIKKINELAASLYKAGKVNNLAQGIEKAKDMLITPGERMRSAKEMALEVERIQEELKQEEILDPEADVPDLGLMGQLPTPEYVPSDDVFDKRDQEEDSFDDSSEIDRALSVQQRPLDEPEEQREARQEPELPIDDDEIPMDSIVDPEMDEDGLPIPMQEQIHGSQKMMSAEVESAVEPAVQSDERDAFAEPMAETLKDSYDMMSDDEEILGNDDDNWADGGIPLVQEEKEEQAVPQEHFEEDARIDETAGASDRQEGWDEEGLAGSETQEEGSEGTLEGDPENKPDEGGESPDTDDPSYDISQEIKTVEELFATEEKKEHLGEDRFIREEE